MGAGWPQSQAATAVQAWGVVKKAWVAIVCVFVGNIDEDCGCGRGLTGLGD